MNNTLSVLFLLVPVLLFALPFWRIFLKANKPGWRSLVPIYNLWEFYGISGVPKWLSLFSLPPYIYLISYFLAGFNVPIGANLVLIMLFNRYAVVALLASIVITILVYAIAIDKLGYRFGKSKKFSLFVLGLPPVLLLIASVLSAVTAILEAMSGTGLIYSSLLTILEYGLIFVVLVGLYILAYGKSKYQDSNSTIANMPNQAITQPTAQYPSQPVQAQPIMPAPQAPAQSDDSQAPNEYQSEPTEESVVHPNVQTQPTPQPPIDPPQPPPYV